MLQRIIVVQNFIEEHR